MKSYIDMLYVYIWVNKCNQETRNSFPKHALDQTCNKFECRNVGKCLRDIKYSLPWMFESWNADMCPQRNSAELRSSNPKHKVHTLISHPICNYLYGCVPSCLLVYVPQSGLLKRFKKFQADKNSIITIPKEPLEASIFLNLKSSCHSPLICKRLF